MEENISSEVKEAVSRCVSETLDNFGYSANRRAVRAATFDQWSAAKTLSTRQILKNDKIDKVFVGSLREGIGLLYESDIDILQINNGVICVDKEEDTKDCLAFQLVQEHVPAGYALLKLTNSQSNSHAYLAKLKPALEQRDGQLYLSREEFMKINDDVFHQHKGWLGRNTIYKERNGPSIPKNVQPDFIKKLILKFISGNLNDDMDFVRAFPCTCPNLAQAWCTRSRGCDWPTTETIQQVSNTQTYVVPVGRSGHTTETLQWRISFIQAEILLVRAFNDTQAKVLILLRHIGRHILSPICADITSYVMKNVMFWLAESCPREKFQEKYLLERLEDALRFLAKCIEERKLANYMIPDRNMFEGKLKPDDQSAVLHKINDVITNCAMIALDTSTSDHLGNLNPDFQEIELKLNICNILDLADTLKSQHLTIEQLADYNSFIFYCSSKWTMYAYNIYKVLLPLIWHTKWPLYSISEENLPAIDEGHSQFPSMSLPEGAEGDPKQPASLLSTSYTRNTNVLHARDTVQTHDSSHPSQSGSIHDPTTVTHEDVTSSTPENNAKPKEADTCNTTVQNMTDSRHGRAKPNSQWKQRTSCRKRQTKKKKCQFQKRYIPRHQYQTTRCRQNINEDTVMQEMQNMLAFLMALLAAMFVLYQVIYIVPLIDVHNFYTIAKSVRASKFIPFANTELFLLLLFQCASQSHVK